MKKIILPGQKNASFKEATKLSGNVTSVVLKKKRSKKYLDLFISMDHGKLNSTGGMEELMKVIEEEFGTAGLQSLPLAIIAKCYLGAPYEVHTLDLGAQMIIHHYKRSEPLPTYIEKARSLALHHAYSIVEVYTDQLIVINDDGSAIKL